MQFISSTHNQFYADLPNYRNRLRVLTLAFLVGMPLSELFYATLANYYPALWPVTIGLTGLGMLFLFATFQLELSKKQLATIATICAVFGTYFLFYRAVVNDFSPIMLAEIAGALILISFVFERIKYLIYYSIALFIGVGFVIPNLDWSQQNHIIFLTLIGFATIYFAISFTFKIGQIRMLQFAERTLSAYDKYIIVCDDKGDVVYVSPHIISELGIDPKEVDNTDWWKLRGLDDDEIAHYKSIIVDRINRNEHIPIYEQILVKPSGEKRTIQWNAQVIAGKFHIGLGTDITDALNTQKESEKLSKVTMALGAGVIIVNEVGKIKWCNTSFCDIFGYSEEELLGNKPSDLFKVPAFFSERYKKLAAHGIKDGQQYEIPHYHKSGRLIWVLVKSSHIYDKAGNLIEAVEVITDITEQKNKELEFKQISLIAERTQTPVLICDEFFLINWFNSAMLAEFDCAFNDIIGKDFLSFYAGEWTAEEPVEILIKSIKKSESCQIDIQLQNKNKPQWYKLSMDPIKDDFGNVQQYMIIMQNIQKFKDAQWLIESKNKDLVASISYAQRIQRALLPNAQFVDEILPEHFFMYRPKDIVSGDFYFAKYCNDKLFVAIADCTGHGVPGAMITSIGAAALNNAIFDQQLTDPAEILEQTDAYVKYALSATEEGLTDGMDLGIIAFDFENNRLEYSGARRPLVILDKLEAELICLQGDKRSVGEFIDDDNVPFTTQYVEIESEKVVYLFTDGISDQFGGERAKRIRFKRVLELIRLHYTKEMEDQKREFCDFYKQWTHNYEIEQTDDMLLFAAQITPEYMFKMKSNTKTMLPYENQ